MLKKTFAFFIFYLLFFNLAIAKDKNTEGWAYLSFSNFGSTKNDVHTGLGTGVFSYTKDKIGYFAFISIGPYLGDKDYTDDFSVNAFGDKVIETKKIGSSFGLGITWVLYKKDDFATGVFGGINNVRIVGVAKQYDSLKILSKSGYYWVEDSSLNKTFLAPIIGLSFQYKYFSLQTTYVQDLGVAWGIGAGFIY